MLKTNKMAQPYNHVYDPSDSQVGPYLTQEGDEPNETVLRRLQQEQGNLLSKIAKNE